MSEIRQSMMGRVRHIHFVGIGGAGMSGIAEILHNLGYKISGSDLKGSHVTQHLQKLGITVMQGHCGEHVIGSDVVVVSSAVAKDNPELQAAREKRIPVIPRAEMLAELMRFRHGIAIAGTHGKTTTTSLIASILAEAGLDPTFVIGGQLNSIGSNAKLGGSKYLVAEADESDASFLHLQPLMAVLTNIDADHLETYGGEFEKLSNAFLEFLQRLPFYGMAVLCIDDKGIRNIISEMTKPFITYGIDHAADFTASDIRFNREHTSFRVSGPDHPDWLQINLNLPGKHNVLNALAAIAIAAELGIAEDSIARALQNFQGIARRCNVLGEIIINNNKVMVIDDYAHHPSEISAVLSAIRTGWPGTRIVVIFQPHRYTRTRDLFAEFCQVLADIDVLLLMNVYPAGEMPVAGADSQALIDNIRATTQGKSLLIKNRDDLHLILPDLVANGDILLIMGAGDIGSLGPELVAQHKNISRQECVN
jgi:UDP-N-acetylmuramate--alanine ligase